VSSTEDARGHGPKRRAGKGLTHAQRGRAAGGRRIGAARFLTRRIGDKIPKGHRISLVGRESPLFCERERREAREKETLKSPCSSGKDSGRGKILKSPKESLKLIRKNKENPTITWRIGIEIVG